MECGCGHYLTRCESRQQAGSCRRIPCPRDQRTGDHGGDEGTRAEVTGQLLYYDDELFQPEARAAVLLRQMEPEPPELRHVVPELRSLLRRALQKRSRLCAEFVLLGEVAHDSGEGQMVFRDSDPHEHTLVHCFFTCHRVLVYTLSTNPTAFGREKKRCASRHRQTAFRR